MGDDSKAAEQEQETIVDEKSLDILGDEDFPVMPLRNTVLFPQQIIPIYIGREQSLKLIEDLPSGRKMLVVAAQKDGSIEVPTEEDLYRWGTLAVIMKIFDMPDNSKSAIVQGIARVKINRYITTGPYFRAQVERVEDTPDDSLEVGALMTNLRQIYHRLIEVVPYLTDEQSGVLSNLQDPARVADRAISMMNIPNQEKQEILEEMDIKQRLEKATVIVNREIQRTELGEKIQSEVQDEISKTQREYYLREQLKAIRRELGEDEQTIDQKELEEKIKAAKMSEEAEKVAMKELERLGRIPPQSPEFTVSRTYIDWLTDLPWSKATEDNNDLENAQQILDEDHYGLDKAKERILEYLAVRNLKAQNGGDGKLKGPILCLAGPPGTGKTSIGRSIARAMGREFIRISLGGVRDEAEIRGHRRTYIGALPGRIIQGLKKAGTNNPIFMLDEIDKLGMDFRGDPSSALLEVLDPEQNYSFNDHYLEIDFDLSNVMFIATANRKDQIPGPLRDRMEILDFTGYIDDEKINIAKNFLVPKQVKENGLTPEQLSFQDSGLLEVIHSYTREAGVRNLEREIANISRKRAREVVEGKGEASVKVNRKTVGHYLGPKTYYWEVAERANEPGIVIGLAWTAAGGDILFIEASRMPGRGQLHLTGQLGDVMKESVRAAWSYVRAHAEDLGIDPNFYKAWDAHVHVPAGAIPKDGPSAGVGMLIAIVSLLTGRRVKEGIAMTGEITLRGRVLPIGGVKEKLTAAHRAGLKQVILPFENKRDMEDVPEKVKKDLKITFVKRMNQILDIALESEPSIPPVTGPPEVSEDGASKERRRPVVDDEVLTEDVVAN
ncbi:MAG: endopeptidase La [Candidatus Marinimicrobia bacterium]|nr:endopeptidase La [Candidatus Neomarinimicrobiota bacterium]